MNSEIIDPNILKDFLQLNNWIWKSNFKNPKMFVLKKFFKQYDEEYTIVFPSDISFNDYSLKMKSALSTFSVLENRKLEDVYIELTEEYKDNIKFRIVSETALDGKIPINEAEAIISGLKRLIEYSLGNEKKRRPYIRKLTKDTKALTKSYKLCQTEVGSYIFNIESGNYDTYEQQLDYYSQIEPHIVRKAIKRIHNGLNLISDDDDIENLKEMSYIVGFNANMCDALVDIYEVNKKVSIETSMKFVKYFDEKIESEPEKIHSINSKEFRKMKILSEYYKNLENYEEVFIEGVITSLNAKWKDYISGVLLNNVISVSWYNIEDRGSHNCKIQLTPEEYKIACDAHRDEKKIRIKGKLDKNRKRWFLENHSDFQII